MTKKIKMGDAIKIRAEWQDEGDDRFDWIAIEDEDGGRVKITPLGTGLTFPPVQVVLTEWLEAK